MNRTICMVALGVAAVLGSGCAAFRGSVTEQDPSKSKALSAKYDVRDLLSWTDEITKLILANPFPPQGEERPVVAFFSIQNRSKTHLDTQALADAISMKLLESGKVRLVNAARRDDLLKEQGYQLANVTPEMRKQLGKQLGAKYMVTGAVTEIESESGRQVRVSKQQDVFYRMTVEITDLETGELILMKQVERMRQASKPIIGW
jgi:penicillin-binding protein activator